MATATTASTSSARPTERQRRALVDLCVAGALLGLGLVAGCQGAPASEPEDTGPGAFSGQVDNIVAFEGQHAFVTLIHAPIDVTDARVTLPPELDVREVRCSADACAIVAEVLDTTASTGTPIPPPIDALVRQIVLETATDRVVGTVNIMPLDRIENAGSVATVRGTYFASSVAVTSGSTFTGGAGAPVRWLVFGDVELAGEITVGGVGSTPGSGGFAGGAIDGAAAGQGAGGVASGGGSSVSGGGAAGGEPWGVGCAGDFFATECGGGGGGGGASAGGGGGGAFALVSLGRLDASAAVRADGAASANGGGGGGGRVLLAAAVVAEAPSVSVAGGAGFEGAAGGDGEQSVETGVTLSLGGDLDHPRYILDTSTFALMGTSVAGAEVRIETTDGAAVGAGTVGSDGTFSVSCTVAAGLSRLRLYTRPPGLPEERSWAGNHVELERRPPAPQLQPIGGLLDVVFLPPV